MSVTIRIPTVKYLDVVLNELDNVKHHGDVFIQVDRWMDELELAELADEEPKGLLSQVLQSKVAKPSSIQMQQLRQHLRGE